MTHTYTVSRRTHGTLAFLTCIALAIGLSACAARQSSHGEQTQAAAHKTHAQTQPQKRARQPLPDRCKHVACINNDVTDFDVDGMHVIVKHEQNPPVVEANIYFNGGALDWTPQTAGWHALALDIATKGGPDSIDRETYRNTLEQSAASISASVGRDYSSVRAFSPTFALEDTFRLMSEDLRSPAFRSQQVAKSRAEQLSAIHTRYDNADSAVAHVVRTLAFKNHPYGIEPNGEVDTVKAASANDLKGALQQLLKREKMTVVFVGKISADTARNLVETYLKDIPSDPDWAKNSGFPQKITPFSYQDAQLDILERTQIPTNYIAGYFAAPSVTDPDYPAMVIATNILSYRLFRELRTKRNLTYAVYSGLGNRRADTGVLYVTTPHPNTALQIIYDTIDQMIDGQVQPEDIHEAVRNYLTRHYLGLQSFNAQANQLAHWALLTGDRTNADRIVGKLQKVSPEEVSAVLKRYIQDIQFGVVGDPDKIDRSEFTAR